MNIKKELSLCEIGKLFPDFTIYETERGRLFYWKHCGMLSDKHYRQRRDEKKAVYTKHEIIEGENLILSCDDIYGSIVSVEI